MAESVFSGSSRVTKEKPRKVAEWEELPQNYGDTKIVLLPRDPYWAFSYWEISEDTKSKLKKQWGQNALSRLVLRVYDVTDIRFDGTNAHRFFDIHINESADNWYVNVPDVNRNWCVDLGIILADGRFIMIARSNVVKMPRHGVSPITDAQWAILQKEFERLLSLSGVDRIGKSSFDVTKLMKERWEELVSISSAQMPFSRREISSLARPRHIEKKKFWLKADTELIVYGATEIDAKLTVGNDVVPLKPDGTFSLRFALPDCIKTIPIKAVSRDGTMSKRITFKVSRETK